MLRRLALVLAVPITLVAALIAATLFIGGAGSVALAKDCPATGPALTVDGASPPTAPIAGYSGDQLANAALIMHTAQTLRLDEHAQVLGVMTAMGESRLVNLDHGDPAGPDSRGLFQQRANWGPEAVRMDPTASAALFLHALTAVPQWESLPPTIAAHDVQHNSDPYYYAPYWNPALTVVQNLGHAVVETASSSPTATAVAASTTSAPSSTAGSTTPSTPSGGTDADGSGPDGASTCGVQGTIDTNAIYGDWANPLPGAVITQPFGAGATEANPIGHPGVDLAAPEGTPELAVHEGTVVFAGPAQGYGDHYICIDIATGPAVSTGSGSATSTDATACYGHAAAQLVQVGDHVTAGQTVALEGCEGDCTGPHLHFEIRAGLWGPVQDPVPFLAAHDIQLGT